MQSLVRARVSILLAISAFAPGFVACKRTDGVASVESPGGAGGSTGGAADGASRAAGRGVGATERVTLTTSDGWTLVGDYASGAPGSAVLLVHQLSSNRAEWGPLIARLHGVSALSTLAIDIRGHGESTRGPDGTTQWMSFGNDTSRWAGLVNDVGAAVTYLRGRDSSLQRIVIVGSSIGSSAALRYAVDDPLVIGVVMLSPGVSYRGLDTREPLQRFIARENRAALLLAGDGDNRSAESVRALSAVAAGADAGALVTSEVYAGTGAHGVAIGAAGVHPEFWARVDGWIRAQIDPIAAAARAAATRSVDAGGVTAMNPAPNGADRDTVANTGGDAGAVANADASAVIAPFEAGHDGGGVPARDASATVQRRSRTRTRTSDAGAAR